MEQQLTGWVERKGLGELEAAFSAMAQVGAPPGGATPGLRSRTLQAFQALSEAYLPLLPDAIAAKSCIVPLWACAKLGCWQPSDLPAALVRRLGKAPATTLGGPACGEALVQGATAQGHANLWWSLSRAAPALAALAEAEGVLRASAAGLVRMRPEQLGTQCCANVLLACARLRRCADDPALLHHMAGCLAASGRDAKCQELANALFALGELAEGCGHRPDPEDLRGLAEEVVVRIDEGLVRKAKAQPQGRAQGQGEGQQIANRGRGAGAYSGGGGGSRRSFIPQELSNMLLGCAKLGPRSTPPAALVGRLAAAAGQAAPLFESQGFSNSLYALAKLGCGGCGSDGCGEEQAPAVQRLWREAHRRLLADPDSFTPQALSNLLLALEGLRPAGYFDLAGALAAECRRRGFAGFNAQNIANSAWALAKMDWLAAPGWYGAVAVAAQGSEEMAAGGPRAWANLLYGLALVRHRPDAGLLRALSAAACSGGGGCRTSAGVGPGPGVLWAGGGGGGATTSQDCANLLWALAVLALPDRRLVGALVERLAELVQRDVRQVPAQDLANSLWALAVMGPEELVIRHGSPVETLLREAAERFSEAQAAGEQGRAGLSAFAPEGLAQLWQVQLELVHAAACGADGLGLYGILGQADEAAGGALFAAGRRALMAAELRTSRMQSEVAQSLYGLAFLGTGHTPAVPQPQPQPQPQWSDPSKGFLGSVEGGLGWPAEGQGSMDPGVLSGAVILSVSQEALVEPLGTRVDVLLEVAGRGYVAVEVDGPFHFFANEAHARTPTGPTRLRDRQLERLFGAGKVVSVPYWEWQGLRGEAQRQVYLGRLLGLWMPGV